MKHKLDHTIREWFRLKSFGLYAPSALESTRSLEVGATYAIRAFSTRRPVAIPTIATWHLNALRDITSITCLERGAVELALADGSKTSLPAPTTKELDRVLVLRDDLECIYRITPQLQADLNSAGILRFEQIAQWSDTDVAYYGGRFGSVALIRQHKWVEQCTALARGEDTPHSRQRKRDKARKK